MEVLLYLLDLGPIEQDIARQAMQARKPLPSNIQNAPELDIGLQLYLQAFFDLDSERSHAYALVRIPSSAIRLYAREFEFDETQTELLDVYIAEMDNANLARLKRKQDAKSS